jgi:hypothetical protein
MTSAEVTPKANGPCLGIDRKNQSAETPEYL